MIPEMLKYVINHLTDHRSQGNMLTSFIRSLFSPAQAKEYKTTILIICQLIWGISRDFLIDFSRFPLRINRWRSRLRLFPARRTPVAVAEGGLETTVPLPGYCDCGPAALDHNKPTQCQRSWNLKRSLQESKKSNLHEQLLSGAPRSVVRR